MSELICQNCGGIIKQNNRGRKKSKFCSPYCNDRFHKSSKQLSGKKKLTQQEWRHSVNGYASRFIERAKLNTVDTDLTQDYLISLLNTGTCNITGIPFRYKNEFDSYHNPYAPSIDRIDSSKGYYKDNVQIILATLNRMKNDLPNDDFIVMLYDILSTWRALNGI